MSTGAEDISMADQPDRERYELAIGGELAGFVQYVERDGVLDFVHTEVLPAFEGRGLAGRVAQFALDDARRRGRKVVPSCSYIARYIERHPDLHDLVAGAAR
jgi:uncharacterized protein